MMIQQTAIKLFEARRVRTLWDDAEEKWYFSVVDVVSVLTDTVWMVVNIGTSSSSDSKRKGMKR